MTIKSFEDLECWKAYRVVRNNVRSLIKKYPFDEKYALTNNI